MAQNDEWAEDYTITIGGGMVCCIIHISGLCSAVCKHCSNEYFMKIGTAVLDDIDNAEYSIKIREIYTLPF